MYHREYNQYYIILVWSRGNYTYVVSVYNAYNYWVTMLYIWNQYTIVYQLYSNLEKNLQFEPI